MERAREFIALTFRHEPWIMHDCKYFLPGPSSTDRGAPVENTGSPTVRPAIINQVSIFSQKIYTHLCISSFKKKKQRNVLYWMNVWLTGIFVALNRGGVTFDLDDLTDKLVPTNLDQLVHLWSWHSLGDNHSNKMRLEWLYKKRSSTKGKRFFCSNGWSFDNMIGVCAYSDQRPCKFFHTCSKAYRTYPWLY